MFCQFWNFFIHAQNTNHAMKMFFNDLPSGLRVKKEIILTFLQCSRYWEK